MEAEKIVLKRRKSRRGFLLHYILIIGCFFLGFYSLLGGSEALRVFVYVFFGFGIFLLIYSEIKIRTKRLIVTDKRIVIGEGILKKHSITVRYDSITEIVSKQSLSQRILNCGDLSITTAGAKRREEIVIDRIAAPGRAKETIERFMGLGHKI